MPTAPADPGWDPPLRRAIGQAILESGHPDLVPREIAERVRRDPSNVKDDCEDLVAAGLLKQRAPTRQQLHRGRKAEWAYALAHPDEFRRLLPARAALREGQHVVFADMGAAEDLADVLADPDQTTGASSFAVSDGDPQEYVIVFEGDGAQRHAQHLVVALKAVGITCRRAHISEVGDIAQLASQADEDARGARAVRMRQRTRRGA
jgi:hypothetical protein